VLFVIIHPFIYLQSSRKRFCCCTAFEYARYKLEDCSDHNEEEMKKDQLFKSSVSNLRIAACFLIGRLLAFSDLKKVRLNHTMMSTSSLHALGSFLFERLCTRSTNRFADKDILEREDEGNMGFI
jgi:hypothetical protein